MILADWERDNRAAGAEFDKLVKNGQHSRADTLFSIFDAEGKLDHHNWLRWARVKSLIGDYDKIAGLYCRVIDRQPGFIEVTLHQFGQLLEDMDTVTADKILHQFYECSSGKTGSDILFIRSWLANVYSGLGLFRQELDMLKILYESGDPVAGRTLEAARRRFSIRKYREAIDAAMMSYRITDRSAVRSVAATIIYQSYINLGIGDSASQWINRAEHGSDKSRIDAVTFFQSCGDYASAGRLIDSLPSSVARDSLTIRQFVLQGDVRKACTIFSKPGLSIHRDQKSASLWRARLLIFGGKPAEFAAFMDTLRVEPFWESAAELISYQYWVELLRNSSEALAAWAEIQYNWYCGSFHKISEILDQNRISGEYRWKLALHAAKLCSGGGRFRAALQLLSNDSIREVSPEFLYYKAEALYHCGEHDSARIILNNIMLEHPADPFSEKARIFLNF